MGVSRKTRGSIVTEVKRCRCGATPAIAETQIDNGVKAHAIHCSLLCGADSHWQMSLDEAIRRWNAGLVRGARGGNGDPADDLNVSN